MLGIYMACGLMALKNQKISKMILNGCFHGRQLQIQNLATNGQYMRAECWQGIQLSEYEDIERVSELAQLLEEHGKAYAVYFQHYGNNYATEEDFKDRYLGEYEDEKDFVYQMWEECGKIQQLEELNIPSFYIDWKAIVQDWFIDSYFSIEVELRETYVFSR